MGKLATFIPKLLTGQPWNIYANANPGFLEQNESSCPSSVFMGNKMHLSCFQTLLSAFGMQSVIRN